MADPLPKLTPEFEAALIAQEHRLTHNVYNVFLHGFAQRTDPRKSAAWRALIWGLFSSGQTAAVGVGVVSMIGLLLALKANDLLDEQNALIRNNNDLNILVRRSQLQQEAAQRRYDEITKVLADSDSLEAQRAAVLLIPDAMVMPVDVPIATTAPNDNQREFTVAITYPNLQPLKERLLSFMRDDRILKQLLVRGLIPSGGSIEDVDPQKYFHVLSQMGPVSNAILDTLHRLGSQHGKVSRQGCIWKIVSLSTLDSSSLHIEKSPIEWEIAGRLTQLDLRHLDRGEMDGVQLPSAQFTTVPVDGPQGLPPLFPERFSINNSHLEMAQMPYVALTHATMKYSQLQGAALSYADFTGSDFSFASLVGADLSHVMLRGAKFCGTELQSAILRYTEAQGSNFSNATLFSTDFMGSHLQATTFDSVNAYGASFESATLQGAIFTYCDLCGVDFSVAKLQQSEFLGGDLSGARFLAAELNGARFGSTDLMAPHPLPEFGGKVTRLASYTYNFRPDLIISWYEPTTDEINYDEYEIPAATFELCKLGPVTLYGIATEAMDDLRLLSEAWGLNEVSGDMWCDKGAQLVYHNLRWATPEAAISMLRPILKDTDEAMITERAAAGTLFDYKDDHGQMLPQVYIDDRTLGEFADDVSNIPPRLLFDRRERDRDKIDARRTWQFPGDPVTSDVTTQIGFGAVSGE